MGKFSKSIAQMELENLDSKKYILSEEYEKICNECKKKILETESKIEEFKTRKNKRMNEFYKKRNCSLLINLFNIIILFAVCNNCLLDFNVAIETSLPVAFCMSLVIDIPIYLCYLEYQYNKCLEYVSELENDVLLLELDKEHYKKMIDKAKTLYYNSFVPINVNANKTVEIKNYNSEDTVFNFRPLTRKLERKKD